MAHPVGPLLQERIAQAAADEGIPVHRGGTYVCIEGPQFSSYAESLTYKGLDYDVVGMTNMPEAKLAREAEITYASIAMVTDFDCWHPEHDDVDVAKVIEVAQQTPPGRATHRPRRPRLPGRARALSGALRPRPRRRHDDGARRCATRPRRKARRGGGAGAERGVSGRAASRGIE